jgi:hypothetical protein
MGLFDSLIWSCPFCGVNNEAQTKSGPCLLDDFHMEDDLPLWLMEDLNGSEEVCVGCTKRLKLVFDLKIKVKKKAVEPVDNLDIIELAYRKKEELQNSNKPAIIRKRRKKA